MSKAKYTFIGHNNLLLCNPVSSAKYDEVSSKLSFPADATCIDFGAGKGEISLRIVERHEGVAATILEWDESLLNEAEKAISSRIIPRDRILLNQVDAKAFYIEKCKGENLLYDLTICVGSCHIFGGYKEAIQSLSEITKDGGFILIGDLYWRNPGNISQEFLEFLQMPPSDLLSHDDHISIASKITEGVLQLIWETTVSEEEFDCYENAVNYGREEYCRNHPDDPDNHGMLERGRSWFKAYQKWGRNEFGFGLYLFKKVNGVGRQDD
jgi:SAM-dependent methyltransferase